MGLTVCCIKVLKVVACLQLAERLFQSFAPLTEKDFLPFSVLFLVAWDLLMYCVVYMMNFVNFTKNYEVLSIAMVNSALLTMSHFFVLIILA